MRFSYPYAGCTWRVSPVNLTEELKERFDEPGACAPLLIASLPENWADLEWHKCVQDPCLDGDDLYVAATDTRVYIVFDSVCTAYPRRMAQTKLEYVLKAACRADF